MNNAHTSGNQIVTAAPSAVAPNDAVIIGSVLGVAFGKYGSGDQGVFDIRGGFDLPMVSADTVAAGERLFWDITEGALSTATAATGDLEAAAIALSDAGNGDTQVAVALTPEAASVAA